MLGLGALFLSFSVEYAPEVYSLLFGEVLGHQRQRARADDRRSAVVRSAGDRGAVAAAAARLGAARGRAGRGSIRSGSSSRSWCVVALATTMTVPVVGTAADLQPDDRPAGRGALVHRPTRRRAARSRSRSRWRSSGPRSRCRTTRTSRSGSSSATISAASYALGRVWSAVRSRRRSPPRVTSLAAVSS